LNACDVFKPFILSLGTRKYKTDGVPPLMQFVFPWGENKVKIVLMLQESQQSVWWEKNSGNTHKCNESNDGFLGKEYTFSRLKMGCL
jgi:hypothetical protein